MGGAEIIRQSAGGKDVHVSDRENPSNSRLPPPKMTGAMMTVSSSTIPASSEPTGEDAVWLAVVSSRVGAVVGGRGTYEAARHWGDTNPWRLPFFIVTHRPEEEPRGGEFTFVAGVEAALEPAFAPLGSSAYVQGPPNTHWCNRSPPSPSPLPGPSFGPVMYPSTDVVIPAITFAIVSRLSWSPSTPCSTHRRCG